MGETQSENQAKSYLDAPLNYIDEESIHDQDKIITPVSGFMAGRAFNEICIMLGGMWPDAKLQEEAPEAYAFFMKLFDEGISNPDCISTEEARKAIVASGFKIKEDECADMGCPV